MPQHDPFLEFAPPGHFYSPVPDMQLVDHDKDKLFDRSAREIAGIDLRIDDQLALLRRFAEFYDEVPFQAEPSEGLRYYFENQYFSYGDALVLYSMLRLRQPRTVVEVGSGFSTAVMLDTNDRFCAKQIAITSIDPYPERLLSLMTDRDRAQHEVLRDGVQHVPINRFAALGANDILFVDSSHVVKIGSDVVYLITDVLPRLREGVVVHFHDVFWPFQYPEEWVLAGRAWSEAYILKAFLQFNAAFKVLFFNSYIGTHHGELAKRELPLFVRNPGGSLWIERVC